MTYYVVLATDDNVVAPTGILLNSIAKYNSNSDICVHILHTQLSGENLQSLMEFGTGVGLTMREHHLDGREISQLSLGLREVRFTPTTLLRCYMAELLPTDIETVLYLDIDIVVNGALAPIYNTDLKGKIAGVVYAPDSDTADLDVFGVNKEEYFSSGVMLIDLQKWRDHEIGSKTVTVLRDHSEACYYWDQCALNVALIDNTVGVSNAWNYYISSANRIDEFQDLKIIHYAGGRKPWIDAALHPLGLFYTNASRGTPWEQKYVLKPRNKKEKGILGKLLRMN